MADSESTFALSRDIDRYLAALSKLYGQKGERLLQQVIVNAQVRVHEEWTYDGIDGGVWGHALYLILPDSIYLAAADDRGAIQERIRHDIENVHNVPREYIATVFLEMEVTDDSEWRQESGALMQTVRQVSDRAARRIWEEGQYRAFLSHKASVKKETAALKENLTRYGVSGFVAHSDIHPTKEWQEEIENALATMDAFVALMTADFHESDWTDQEVGYAFARGVPIIAVRLGRDPYGFIGKFQGLASDWENAPLGIAKLLIRHDRMFAAYVERLKTCPSFDEGNVLAALLPSLEGPTEQQMDAIIEAYNKNFELRGSFAFNGRKSAFYGPGLLTYLNKWSQGRAYVEDSNGVIVWF